MMAPAAGSLFDAHWLRLRQAADARARDAQLTQQASRWLRRRQDGERVLSLVDLGSGSGSNLEFLAAHFPGPQRWRLVDHDCALLAEATARYHRMADNDGGPIELIADCHDLVKLDVRLLDDSDLICGSALFDLVSRDWLEQLVAACVARQAAALFTLSVNGAWTFTDRHGQPLADNEDRWVHDHLCAHQQRDKGFGPALGGEAPQALSDAFSRHGYHVADAPSPWRLAAGQADTVSLGPALIDGWAQAVREQRPQDDARLLAWLTTRRRAIDAGTLGLEVAHSDIFAAPREAN